MENKLNLYYKSLNFYKVLNLKGGTTRELQDQQMHERMLEPRYMKYLQEM